MTNEKFDIATRLDVVERLIDRTSNSRHRAILLNYHRHSTLEVCGYYEEILGPDMTVEHPMYAFHSAGRYWTVEGMPAVRDMYRKMVESGSTTIHHTDEVLAVDDHGFLSEYMTHRYWRGADLARRGQAVPNPALNYIVSQSFMVRWPFDADGRMIGERVFYGNDLIIRECPEDEFVTLEETRAKLMPLVRPLENFR